MSARGGARARFLPPAPSTSCRLRWREKGRRKSWAPTRSASGRWARGRGAAERRRLGDAGDPRPPPPPPAPDRPRRARRERRPHRREQSASLPARRRRPARGRPPGEVGRRRGKCAGRRVGRGRREHAALGASGARPWPAPGAQRRTRGRGLSGLPGDSQVREEEKKGSGAGASAGRRGEEGTPPCRAGRAGGGGGCIIATLTLERRNSAPPPPSPPREGSPGGPRGGPGALCPPRRPAVRSVNGGGGWRPSGQRGEEGGRRGTRCLFGSHRGLSSPGARGRGHPAGCGAGLRVRSGPARPGGRGEGRRTPGGKGGRGRLRGRSRRPRAAIITEPPFSEWLFLEESGAVGAHPKLPAGRPLWERPGRAGGAGSAPATGRAVSPEVTFRDCSRLDFKLVFFSPLFGTMDKRKVATHMESFLLNC